MILILGLGLSVIVVSIMELSLLGVDTLVESAIDTTEPSTKLVPITNPKGGGGRKNKHNDHYDSIKN